MIAFKAKNNLIEEASRDGGVKKYTNKSNRENNRQGAPCILFSSNMVSMKTEIRDAPCLLFSLLLMFVYFFAFLLLQFNCFSYLLPLLFYHT